MTLVRATLILAAACTCPSCVDENWPFLYRPLKLLSLQPNFHADADMLRRMPTICVLICLSWAILSLGQGNAFCQSDLPQAANLPEEIVLLDNGRVLKGQVMRTADQVHVHAPQGSRIVLPSKRVDRIFDSMEDVWQHRNAKLAADDVQGHLSLLHWCLNHQLADQARQQLNHLMQTDVDVRRLKYLDRQIARTFEERGAPPSKKGNVAPQSAAAFDPFDVAESFVRLPPLDSKNSIPTKMIVDRAIALASHSEPASDKEPAVASLQVDQNLTKTSLRKELESMTDLLDRDDLHQFQRRVQPVLLKGCLAAKCHQANAAVMPLMHRGRGQLVPKRFTQRNLLSILPWVDAEAIDNSLLLTRATVAHGGQESPAMLLDSTEFQRLSNWVQAVAENSPELLGPSETAVSVSDEAPQSVGAPGRHTSDRQNQPVVAKPAATAKRLVPKAKSSVDPFDPAAFNQLPE